MKQAKCTRCSCWRGARWPGSNPNSSSRGEKTLPACEARSVGSAQDHTLPSISLQCSLVFASCLQGSGAFGTQCGFMLRPSSPLSARTFLDGPFYESGFQLHQTLVDLVFDLHIRRSGIGSPPLFNIRQDLCTHLPQGLVIHRFSAPSFVFRVALSYHLPFDETSHLQKIMGHPWANVTTRSHRID